MTPPTLLFLHALGASAREWQQVADHLSDHDCIALDLPGFGDAADTGHADVGTMTDWLAQEIRARALTSCMLVGHSMGGKIATLVAARAAAGEAGLASILGVVLVAASPPSPEPMDDKRRAEMIAWFADGPASRDDAETFVDANSAETLPEALRNQAIDDVRRSNRAAWLGWLERGSREDWGAAVGQLALPALIIAGTEDGDLGEDAQRRLNLPHYANARVRVVQGAAHLIPYEQPRALAALIREHAALATTAALPEDFARLLDSDRVGSGTRAAMLDRIYPMPVGTALWDEADHATVAALVARILPDCGADRALAGRILDSVAQGVGDGWRFAELPDDRAAWSRGLATLDTATGGFVALADPDQDGWLDRIAGGTVGIEEDATRLSPVQMRLWFEDVRAETVRIWMAQPATMAAIGYDGFAVGGDGPRKQGYTRTGADDPEAWQRPSQERGA